MYTLQDDEKEKPTLQDDHPSIIPSESAVINRAVKANFALGESSPGVETIQNTIAAGDEAALRQQVANEEDLANEQARNDIIAKLAAQNGGQIDPDTVEIVRGLTHQQLRTDPATVLEKKFADRWINYTLLKGDEIREEEFRAAHQASNLTTDIQVLHKMREDREAQYQANTSWTKAILLNAEQMFIPGLPWWRQAQALKDRPNHNAILPGQTVRENVSYWWSLPPEQRMPTLQRVLKDFDDKGQPLDARTFLDALIAYPSSEEFLANSMGVADYATGASMFWKLGASTVGKGFGVKVPKKPVGSTAVDAVEEAKPGLPRETVRPPEPEQLDLFPDLNPPQGAFRFMIDPEQLPPIPPSPNALGAIRNPRTGQMQRANIRDSLHPNDVSIPHNTPPTEVSPTGMFRGDRGRFQRSTEAMRQQEFDLAAPEHQSDLFGGGPRGGGAGPSGGSEAEKFAATPKSKPPEGGYQSNPKARHADEEKAVETRTRLADAVKAVASPDAKPREILSQTGDLQSAGFLGALERLKRPFHTRGLRDLALEVPTFSNPWAFYESSKALGREAAQRMTNYVLSQGGELIDVMSGLNRPTRMTKEALEMAQENAKVALKNEYDTRLKNGALDFEYVPGEANPWNVDTMIGWVGKNDATLPQSRKEAEVWARDIYKLNPEEYVIEQQGSGFKIGVYKHLDETDPYVRDGMIAGNNRVGDGIVKMLINRLVSSDYLLPPIQRANRNIATHAPQELRKELKDIIEKDIYKALSKQELKELNKILVRNRDEQSKLNPMERGRWYDTAAEFEKAYEDVNGRMPSAAAVKAYDTFRRVSDFDWLLRNFAAYRDKARQGIESWSFVYHDGQGAKKTGFFEGKVLDELPFAQKSDYDAGIWIYDSTTKNGRFVYKHDLTHGDKQYIKKLLDEDGYKVVQIADPKTHPLDGIAMGKEGKINDQIHFVIADSWEKNPLSWKQVDYRPGGHSIYPGRFYVAQPVIKTGRNGKDTFFGDSNIMNVKTEAEAQKWAERLDRVRVLIRSGNMAEAEAYRAANLPHSAEDIKKLFLDNGAPLSLDHPVVWKEGGRNSIDTAHLKGRMNDVVDSTKNPYDLTNYMDKSFLTDRDLIIKTVKEEGMIGRLVDAEQLDPYDALNQAMGQAIRNVWMGDYKISAAENFLRDFADVLKPTDNVIAANPLYWVYNPQWKEGADRSRVAAAKAAQRAIATFLGQRSELSKDLQHIENKLFSTIYSLGGQKTINAIDAVDRFVDGIGLSGIKDPVSFLRAVAFHSNLGFFNPVQLLVQAQSMVHVLGVAGPKNGLPGIAAGVLTQIAAYNPKMLETIAKKSTAFGWKKDDFLEMVTAMKNSGVYQVAGEAAFRDDVFDPKLFRSGTEYFLEKGTMFFSAGERLVRLSAFATAFREAKAARSGAKLTQRDMQDVAERFKTLSVQMGRDSAAAWQQGIFSVPTQFFAFNARLAEQFLGNRLTGVEKLRALATYSTLYGLPVTAGTITMGTSPIPGVPTSYEDIRQEAKKRGIDMSPAYLEALQEGLLSLGLHYATGKEYNVASRFGPGAQTALSNLLKQDKPMWEIAMGASGTILKDMFKATQPFTSAAASVFTDNGDYPVVANDWLNLFRNVKTIDNAAKSYGIAQYGKWITKTGTQVGPSDGMDAAMVWAGLTPMNIQDVYTGLGALKDQAEHQKPYAKDALENFRLGLNAAANGDFKTMHAHFTRAKTAMTAGDFNFEDQNKIYNQAMDLNQDLAAKVNWDLWKRSTASQSDARFQQMIKGK